MENEPGVPKEGFKRVVFCHTLRLENELETEIRGARLADGKLLTQEKRLQYNAFQTAPITVCPRVSTTSASPEQVSQSTHFNNKPKHFFSLQSEVNRYLKTNRAALHQTSISELIDTSDEISAEVTFTCMRPTYAIRASARFPSHSPNSTLAFNTNE